MCIRDRIKSESIVKGFKKGCVFNKMVGSEDDIMNLISVQVLKINLKKHKKKMRMMTGS